MKQIRDKTIRDKTIEDEMERKENNLYLNDKDIFVEAVFL